MKHSLSREFSKNLVNSNLVIMAIYNTFKIVLNGECVS